MKRGRIVENRVLAATLCATVGVLTLGGMMRGAASGGAANGLPTTAAAPDSALLMTTEPEPMMLRASFTWAGHGSDDNWDTPGNWLSACCSGTYPDGHHDDANVPASESGFTINLITEAIDDLSIEGDVDFHSKGGNVVMTVDSLTIVGPARVEVHDNGSDDAKIEADGE